MNEHLDHRDALDHAAASPPTAAVGHATDGDSGTSPVLPVPDRSGCDRREAPASRASDTDRREDERPLPCRLRVAFITGASLALWGLIIAAVRQLL